MRRSLFLLPLMLLAACVEDAPQALEGDTFLADEATAQEDPLVYGADDRREYYQVTDPTQLNLANSTVSLMTSSKLTLSGGNYLISTSSTLASSQGVCTSEPYRAQPTPAFCTGFVVGPDLIATAGHCVTSSNCASTRFVFGFNLPAAGTVQTTVPTGEVYNCASIVSRVQTTTNDYAVIRVNRTITGHAPLPIRRSGAVAVGDPLVVAGHPSGLPLKVAGGATVRSTSAANYFEANVDTYGGNSGSPVINATTGVVEGILVRGNTDYVLSGGCYVSNQCNDAGCPGWEDITRSTNFANFVPQITLCTSDANCNDNNVCNGVETCNLSTGQCAAGTALTCNDGDACTADACNPTTGCTTSALTCNDNNACTVDVCSSATGCSSTPVACGAADGCCSSGCTTANDPDCAAACKPKNQACTANSQCCSRSCNTRRGTCR